MFADSRFKIGIALVGAELLGKIVVELGQGALLDGLHFHFVGDGLAGQLGLGVIGGIDDLGLQLLAGFGAAQGAGEGLDSVLAADLDQRVFAGDRARLGVAFDLALIGDLRPVAVHKGRSSSTGSMVARDSRSCSSSCWNSSSVISTEGLSTVTLW